MVKRWVLDNGLTVVFDEQHSSKVVAFQLWVNVGSADEGPEQIGLAHLHEHMLFKGTARRGPGEVARDIEAHGGEINAWTSFDQTVYHTVIASQFARMGLDVLADAVRNPAFDPHELEREIEVVCEEIKRSEDMPARRASKDLFATAFTVHPYGRPVIGWASAVRATTRAKVLDFYRAHYVPRNMVLSVCGDVAPDTLRGWVDELLGGPLGGAPPPRARPKEPKLTGRRSLLKRERVSEGFLHLGFPIPAVDHEDTPALDLLAMIAGQGDASRLVQEVKRKRSLVNEIHCYAYTPRDAGLMMVSLTLPEGQATKALEETARVLAQLRVVEVADDELATVKALIEAEAIYQRETAQGLARKLGYYQCALGDLELERRYYQRIEAVTAAQLREVAERYLTFNDLVFTALMPESSTLTDDQAWATFDGVGREPPLPARARRVPKEGSARAFQLTALGTHPATPGLTVHRLSSGATVVVREESAVPLFAVRAAFLGGLRFETEANNGITALLSRTLTRGSKNHDAEEISNLVDDMAGSLSGQAGRSSISLRGEFLSRHFRRAFSLFAETLTEPTFPSREFEHERAHLLQDIATREDKPSSVAFELFSRTLYTAHPYRYSLAGERASVEQLSTEHLRDHHARFMNPSQMVLCVVGDVNTNEVLALAEEALGRSKNQPAPLPEVRPDPPIERARRAHRKLDKAQSHVVLGFRGAKVTDPWRRNLELLSTVLSGQGGRLFLELRDKRSLAYSVSSLSLEGVDPGYFAVYIGTSPEKVEQAIECIHAELAVLRDERVSDAELLRAQRHLIGTHEIGLQRNGARAALMALDQCYGLGADHWSLYAEEVAAITAEQLRDTAQRVINFEQSVLAVVGP